MELRGCRFLAIVAIRSVNASDRWINFRIYATLGAL